LTTRWMIPSETGSSWTCFCGSCIYNYIYNKCLLPLKSFLFISLLKLFVFAIIDFEYHWLWVYLTNDIPEMRRSHLIRYIFFHWYFLPVETRKPIGSTRPHKEQTANCATRIKYKATYRCSLWAFL
jgi:hypothetical protein